jgi:hypothetical protein
MYSMAPVMYLRVVHCNTLWKSVYAIHVTHLTRINEYSSSNLM